MKLGISPIVNFAFIKLFASEENESVLHPFNMQEFEDDKQSILDVKATDSLGRIFNIEMQLSNHSAFVPRIVFYGCELYADQLREGDDYTERSKIFRKPTKRSVGYTCCFMLKITIQRV